MAVENRVGLFSRSTNMPTPARYIAASREHAGEGEGLAPKKKERRVDSYRESTRPVNFNDQPSFPTQGVKDSYY